MIAILRTIEPDAGWDFASEIAPSNCPRDYAQDVRLEGGLCILW
jgi:hypothetical protein